MSNMSGHPSLLPKASPLYAAVGKTRKPLFIYSDDSDDQIYDYLINSNKAEACGGGPGDSTSPRNSRGSIHLYTNNNNSNSSNNNTSNNKNIPIASVPIIITPHSPGTKFSGILDDSLNQLQCIRESLMQMKNPAATQNFGALNTMMNNSRLFSSCPSLPDLTITGNTGGNNFWPNNQMYGLNTDRRKSWTAIEDLTECANKSNKSASLSSVDSEESLRAAERLHNRASRNSAGGISTHSLNEAELARDFERIAKRNLAPIVCRIPLQKSISTPSIAPVRNQTAKEEKTISASRHLSDSEDENQDDRSLLCVRDKNEPYADHPEKRRKRGSLFFRKKKDKAKTKGQSTNCDVCGALINLSSYKEHAIECKAKIAKSQHGKSGSGKVKSSNSHANSQHEDYQSRDYYDGHTQNDQHISYPDDTPLMKGEFLNDPHITAHDLDAEPILGIAKEEPDSWSPKVPREIIKSLKDKQIKRQEHIYEFIMTEKHHCQTLLVMKAVFQDSLQKIFINVHWKRLFPRLEALIELHKNFLKKLRMKQNENYIIDSIADILLEFFSSTSAQQLKENYGEFCSNHRSALDTFKCCMTEDQVFGEWYKHVRTNPLLKKKGIPECILFVTQRLTKYPLLIDPLLKCCKDDRVEQEKLEKSMSLVKEILVDVDARVAEAEKSERLISIFKKIEAKSHAFYKKDKFKKSDLMDSKRKLKFEGVATLMQGRSKMQTVVVVVLSDCLFFLQENSQKYTFFTPENKAGVVSLQKLLIREKAGTESRGIYIISSNPAYPEMYELKVQNPKDKNVWIRAIRAAVIDAPSDDLECEDFMTAEQKQKIIDARQANMRQIITMGTNELEDKLRQKDLEQAIILEEKIALMLNLWNDNHNNAEASQIPNIENFIANFGSYRELVTDNCDTIEIWKRVVLTIQEIIQLASNLYSAATGLPLSRSFSSVGEKQSELFISPTLPKRAETFGGFDERRMKQNNLPWRDAVMSTLPVTVMTSNRDMNPKRDSLSGADSDSNCISIPHSTSAKSSSDNVSMKDNNFAALQVSDHLHTLLCIISQQMTTIQSLQQQLVQYRDQSSRNLYKHNDQLEELRNLQDKLQEEKTSWLREKEQQERDLDERRQQLKELQDQMRSEQEDIKQQREQLYRKMEILSSQGLLISPNVALPVPNIQPAPVDIDHRDGQGDDNQDIHQNNERRKEKWRTSSISKATSPGGILGATNTSKVHPSQIKQQLPLKLSSNTKSEKSSSISSPIMTSPPTTGNSSGSSMTQMFPLKLADKKTPTSTNPTANHSRTGSSPAVIQNSYHSGNPAVRTNTYPKIPDRVRIRSTDGFTSPQQQQQQQGMTYQVPVSSSMVQKRTTNPPQLPPQHHIHQQHHTSSQSPPQPPPRTFEKDQSKDEEVIYF